jgi:hypothetical protein
MKAQHQTAWIYVGHLNKDTPTEDMMHICMKISYREQQHEELELTQ